MTSPNEQTACVPEATELMEWEMLDLPEAPIITLRSLISIEDDFLFPEASLESPSPEDSDNAMRLSSSSSESSVVEDNVREEDNIAESCSKILEDAQKIDAMKSMCSANERVMEELMQRIRSGPSLLRSRDGYVPKDPKYLDGDFVKSESDCLTERNVSPIAERRLSASQKCPADVNGLEKSNGTVPNGSDNHHLLNIPPSLGIIPIHTPKPMNGLAREAPILPKILDSGNVTLGDLRNRIKGDSNFWSIDLEIKKFKGSTITLVRSGGSIQLMWFTADQINRFSEKALLVVLFIILWTVLVITGGGWSIRKDRLYL